MRNDDLDRVVVRGLHLNHPDPITATRIARHFKLDEADVHQALLRLRKRRIARDRRRKGQRVWGPWS